MRAEPPDNRLEVPWRKAVSVKWFFELYSSACSALEEAGKTPQLEDMRYKVNHVSKTQKQSLDIIQEFVRFG